MNTIYDNTFVLGNTSATTYQAGPGISITQPSEGTVRIANDETVLWSGLFTTATSGIPLSEAADNFEKLKFVHYWYGNGTWSNWTETVMPVTDDNITLSNITQINTGDGVYFSTNVIKFDTTAHNKFVHIAGYRNTFKNENPSTTDITYITKVVGINRISGGNA